MMREKQDELCQQLFGDQAFWVITDIADYRDSLYPSELSIIKDAIEKRIFEFSSGRYCAHQALKAFGIENFPVTRGEQREPLWPENIVGSISHCRDIAAAAVAKTKQVRSIGLDIENRRNLNIEIARHVCTDEEIDWIDSFELSKRNDLILQIFSAKEAVFKCIYPVTGTYLGFKQCEIVYDKQNHLTGANIQSNELSLPYSELSIRSKFTDTHVYSSAVWHHLPAVG